jgi:Rab guanine nucleotide exchange factor SEC2
MAAVVSAPGLPRSRFIQDADTLSTIRDPRSPGDDFPSPRRGSADSSPHPDLNIEVATLSNKLISAINHQTHLDDALAATRQELEVSGKRLRELDAENKEHRELLASGELVKKSELDELKAQLAEERRRRQIVEKDKKSIELELETLSAALFEEANQVSLCTARQKRLSNLIDGGKRTQRN